MAFSPRTRGCSFSISKTDFEALVFPAYAGMFLSTSRVSSWVKSFPRVRGDVPGVNTFVVKHFTFSPRTRGCSVRV